jgi:hypothetical protein
LQQIAARDEVRQQLRQWALDFEDEARAIENARDYSAVVRARNEAA